ncbi:MAG: aminopeptidase [Desulfobacterales bacterium]|nr:aminopeptidase [Desulfobacterales bacterium]
MFTNRQIERYADVLLWGLEISRKGRIRKNDTILIRYHLPALVLAEALYERLLERGLNPLQRVDPSPGMERSFFKHSNRKQLLFHPPGDRELYENLNGSIFLHAPESITHLSDIDPGKIGKFAVSRKYLRDILTRREEKGEFSWTLCTYPTRALAAHAKLTQKEYCQQIITACFLNKTNPLAQWRQIFKDAGRIKRWLSRMAVKHYHIQSANTDLEITPGQERRWIGVSGHNIPSFELFVSPDWRGTRGVYFANQPSFRNGNYVTDIRLEFNRGKVIGISAEKGENFVKNQLAMDKGARRLGEFSLTDKRFSKINRFMANTLFDENFGGSQGNCHVALGASYSDTYAGEPASLTRKLKERLGFNDSALHWDLVNTEKKRVVAHLKTGKRVTIYENGKFNY